MRRLRAASLLAVVTLGTATAAPVATAAALDDAVELTLVSTTDTHGHVYDWDYFANAPYPADGTLGLTRVATEVDRLRAEKGDDSVLVVDNGDAIQGTPLTYYYGLGDGAAGVLSGETTHPMAAAFNTIGYDAQVVGNHEYNYGLDMLRSYEGQLNAPLLGANVIDVATGEPYHDPYTLIERKIDGRDVTVGVLGLVTPGVRVWDKQYVEGVLRFEDMVATAKKWVPIVEEKADVVVVLAHTGQGTVADVDYDPADLNEDVVNNIATQVPGIDVIVAGHSHKDLPQTLFTNIAGEQVLVTQPDFWAQGLTEVTLNLVPDAAGGLEVDWSAGEAPVAKPVYAKDIAEESPALVAAVAEQHATTIDYVNTPVAQSTEELSAATSRYEDTPIIDFINAVQAETVETALEGTEWADLPVISQASPFSRTAVFPKGQVTIRDIAGLYIYENTLRGAVMTGAEVRQYLEFSARYFTQVEPGAAFDPETGTNAKTTDRPDGVPDYNYDVLSGLDYVIDVSHPAGSRIRDLAHADGSPVADDESFVMAVNNYRQSGGGAYPAIAQAPLVYDDRLEIRQLLIDWATERGVIDPADFFDPNWSLTSVAAGPSAPPPAGPEPSESATPTPPAPSPSVLPVAGGGHSGPLATTGVDAAGFLGGAALLLLAGAALVLVRRKRSA
ncbi:MULTISPECIES: bifunctional metallophosphatase/5'-nucleotidase [unclassified Rathayibacter]|uniref:bifunctional metallophosphatase/5'-nucleotidase n=1 Tax=unclassified Rathayibacter TaxID=2609250 RepID=UPI00188D214E|nr:MULTISPECIES: 5'-nucleotidase C-terminal domain-containing protein [unclassified Rathayibacter]MBF4460966.1 5'-nucleotidase C-terminal domain-containing protein [Rathayibacter sp. VKM Ac-2879]MBF4502377.1 5'-nucleotidase C-terminal domain-containing protein [Rathayibacter sp. VKM Ac-2878]